MRSSAEIQQNLAQVVLLVRSQRATSRRTLADAMQLSPTTAGFYVDQLIAAGKLCEAGVERGTTGRPKRALKTVAQAGWFAGIEFNAERIHGVRVDFSGTISRSEIHLLSKRSTASQILTAINTLLDELHHGAAGPLLGIGLGAPGVVDPKRGVAVDYAFVADWKNIPLGKRLSKRFRVPVTLENNLRSIALAERWFGGAQQLANYVILGPRSGVGIAIVQDGRLITGAHYAAGEIGHWPWRGYATGTHLHDHLSAGTIWKRLEEKNERAQVPSDLPAAFAKLAKTDGPEWRAVIDDFAHVLANLQLLLDSSTYFLHGPLTSLGERFCAEVISAIPRFAPSLNPRPFAFLPSKLGDNAGALGTASLAMENWMA